MPKNSKPITEQAGTKKTGAKKTRARKFTPKVRVEDTIAVLSEEYGPFDDAPRLDPAHELVFTILSQHTSDINSARAFQLLMDRFGTLEAVAHGDVGAIEESISPGGLAKVKAPRIKQVLIMILELNGSLDLSFLAEMPLEESKAWLRQLPGIGPKSAGIILNFAFGRPAMAIDTHIHRVCQRLGLIGPKVNAEKAHEILEATVPSEQVYTFHVSFITHGRQVCKAQRPLCPECVVAAQCPSRKGFVDGYAKAKLAIQKGRAGTDKNKRSRATLPHSMPAKSQVGT